MLCVPTHETLEKSPGFSVLLLTCDTQAGGFLMAHITEPIPHEVECRIAEPAIWIQPAAHAEMHWGLE